MDETAELEYVGFWLRVWACLIDTVVMLAVTAPILWLVYGRGYFAFDAPVAGPVDFLLTWLLPGLVVISFWNERHATPGKMAISAIIVDEKTASPPSLGQHIGRYLAYFIAALPLGLGLVWVAFDRKKQGWHDKLAGTMVIRVRPASRTAP
jgi:uncharacterized RDD family membrane protein YckC